MAFSFTYDGRLKLADRKAVSPSTDLFGLWVGHVFGIGRFGRPIPYIGKINALIAKVNKINTPEECAKDPRARSKIQELLKLINHYTIRIRRYLNRRVERKRAGKILRRQTASINMVEMQMRRIKFKQGRNPLHYLILENKLPTFLHDRAKALKIRRSQSEFGIPKETKLKPLTFTAHRNRLCHFANLMVRDAMSLQNPIDHMMRLAVCYKKASSTILAYENLSSFFMSDFSKLKTPSARIVQLQQFCSTVSIVLRKLGQALKVVQRVVDAVDAPALSNTIGPAVLRKFWPIFDWPARIHDVINGFDKLKRDAEASIASKIRMQKGRKACLKNSYLQKTLAELCYSAETFFAVRIRQVMNLAQCSPLTEIFDNKLRALDVLKLLRKFYKIADSNISAKIEPRLLARSNSLICRLRQWLSEFCSTNSHSDAVFTSIHAQMLNTPIINLPFKCRPEAEPVQRYAIDNVMGDRVPIQTLLVLHKTQNGFCRCHPTDLGNFLLTSMENQKNCRLSRNLKTKTENLLVPCQMPGCKEHNQMIELFKYPFPGPKALHPDVKAELGEAGLRAYGKMKERIIQRVRRVTFLLQRWYSVASLLGIELEAAMDLPECKFCPDKPDGFQIECVMSNGDIIHKCISCSSYKCAEPECIGYFNTNPAIELPHNDLTCKEYAALLSEAADATIIKSNLEYLQSLPACPKCNVRTERIDGCNHIKCAQCQTHWCYECRYMSPKSVGNDHRQKEHLYAHLRESGGCGVFPRREPRNNQP